MKWDNSVYRGPLALMEGSLFVLVDTVIFPAGNFAYPTLVFPLKDEKMKKILCIRGQQAHDILGALKAVATGEGAFPLHEVHRATLQAIGQYLFQSEIDMDALNGSFSGLADKIADPEIRQGIMNMAGILPFLEEENKQARIDTFEHLGSELGFNKKFARELHKLCHNSIAELAICQLRPLSREGGMPLWKAPVIMTESFFHLDGDKKLLAQYESYREMDDGIFGKVLIDYYRDNHFPLPGTPGAVFSNMLKIHDMHHVIAGYPTTPLGEICVIAFADGMMDGDLSKALIGYIAQFQVGLQFDKGLDVWRNQFNPDFVIRAFERGSECNVNFDRFDFDFTDLLTEPLEVVRERFNIFAAGAIMQGPEDLWCGDMGIVGMRQSPDKIEQKQSWFQKLLAASGKNVAD